MQKIGTLLLFATPIGKVLAAKPASEDSYRPWKEVGPFRQDKNGIYFLMDFGCKFCQQYYPAMQQWGSTLPKQFVFLNIPLVYDKNLESLYLAMFYSAIESVAGKGNVTRLAEQMFEMKLSGKSIDPTSLIKLAAQADIDIPKLKAEFASKRFIKKMDQVQRIAERYKPEVTPTTVLGGQYLVSPNLTAGQSNLYMELLSGIVSQKMGAGDR